MDFFSEKERDTAEQTENTGLNKASSENENITALHQEESIEASIKEPEGLNESTAATTAPAEDLPEESTSESNEQIKEPSKKSNLLGFIYDTIELVSISLVLVMVILTVFVRHSPVNGSSMYPTILGRNEGSLSDTVGQDVLLISNFFYTPKKGDIVVVQTPYIKVGVAESLGHPIVKRIIATEHDRVTIDFANWRILINDQVYEDGLNSVPYVFYDNATLVNGVPSKQMFGFYPQVIEEMTNDERCNFKQEGNVCSFTVPEGQVFILGDNRNNSKDSRAIGLIDERWIIGKSLLRVYPFDRIGVVD